MSTIPIFRMELDGMRMQLRTAISQYHTQLDSDMANAVEQYCTPSNLKRVIDQYVFQTLDSIIAEEVKKFYTHGVGRAVIKAEIERCLSTNKTFTPLDAE